MSKQDLVNYIAEETGLTKADATRALDAMMKGITEGLKKEGKVIVNLSNFEDTNFNTALSFLSGAVYAFGGEVYKLDDTRYKLLVV